MWSVSATCIGVSCCSGVEESIFMWTVSATCTGVCVFVAVVLKSPFSCGLYLPLVQVCVFVAVVLKSPFSCGLYPPLVQVCVSLLQLRM